MIWDSILLAIAGWVFVMILTKEGMIFGWWGKLILRFPEWLSEPLGGCEYCIAGQMALWWYLWKYGFNIEIILFISLTIFIVEIINVWKQNN